jgi:WD40 repeat protein
MTEERGAKVRALFDEAVELPTADRCAFLDAACLGDLDLRAEVEGLLAFDQGSRADGTEDAFLKSPLLRPSEPSANPSEPAAAALPRHIGHYRILRLLGAGGMGAVYEAEQDNPRRTVALKVVRPGFASPPFLKRFHHESQILGRLHHPGIAQVYEAGLAEDGQPCFAMEFVSGLPLDEFARLQARTLPARLELMARVCDAVQHAHDQGVVHRDLKPANILVEESGQPKVLDFGVARAAGADLLTGAGLTQTGQLLGTPSYMSPEQVTGDPGATDHRADIYALGVILFELAAHRLPYRLEDRPLVETARLILEEDSPRLGSLNPEMRGDVETIVAKAMEKDRARRYQSAADLAADLRRWPNHEPILARPASALYHLRKFAWRHRNLVAGVLATGLALLLGLVGTSLFAIAEARQRGQAEENARQAQRSALAANQEKSEALYQAYRASLAAASAALEVHDVADAARHLESAPEDLRGWEWAHLRNRLDDSLSKIALPGAGNRFRMVEGGMLISSPDQLRVGVFTSAGLRITDLEGSEQGTVPIGPNGGVHVNVTQTSRGLRVAAWLGDTAFDLLDEAGRVLCHVVVPENKGPGNVLASPDGARLCVKLTGAHNPIAVFNAKSGKRSAVCEGHSDEVWTFAFSPDSSLLASGSEDRTACLWDSGTGDPLATCQGHTSKVLSVAFSLDGQRLLTASADGTVRQWDTKTGVEVEPPYDRHSGEVFSAVYSPDGQLVASAGEDRTIRVWRSTGRQDVAVLHGHLGRVIQVAFAPGGRLLASLSRLSPYVSKGDDTVRVWDVASEATLPVLRGHTNYVYPVAFSPDGRWLASGSWDKTVRFWDAASGEPCASLPQQSFVLDLAFGPDGGWLAVGCQQGNQLQIWDWVTAHVRQKIPLPSGTRFYSLSVSPDGTRVAATVQDEKTFAIRFVVYDIASGKPLCTNDGRSLSYSPDGRYLAVEAADGKTVLLMDERTHETIAGLHGHESRVFKAEFSADSHLLAACSEDRTVRVWERASDGWREFGANHGKATVLTGHTDEVYAVAFHPKGTRLATGGRDGAVWLWDLRRGQDVVRLPGHKAYVWSLAFTPDGTTLASGSGDGTVRLWDTAPLKVRYNARRDAAALRPEAERLVERLWREKDDPDQVVKALRVEPSLSDAQRHAALRAVMRVSLPTKAAPGKLPEPR